MVRLTILCLAIAASASGCGISYSVVPARLVVTDIHDMSVQDVLGVVNGLLQIEGFDDFGRDDEMIALLSSSGLNSTSDHWRIIELQHQYTYLNEQRNLRVEVTDYTDITRHRATLAYSVPDRPFYDISIYEHRPGGFSAAGHRFLSAFRENLEDSLGASVIVATPPPITDEDEYWRITVINTVANLFHWMLAFGVTLAFTGSLSVYLLNLVTAPLSIKRGIFVLVNTWLVTPLPFPMAFIFVILLPNLFAFPWTDLDWYRRVQDAALVSFPIALLMCALISVLFIRDPYNCRGDT